MYRCIWGRHSMYMYMDMDMDIVIVIVIVIVKAIWEAAKI